MKTVMLIDDDDCYRESVKLTLEREGIEVMEADCPDLAFQMLEKHEAPDLIVCDLHMPFTSNEQRKEFVESAEVGIRTVHELAWVYPSSQVVAMTSLSKIDLDRIRPSVEPIPTFVKPQTMNDIAELLCTILVSSDFGGIN
jgi:CheY-like chemotaxis protein